MYPTTHANSFVRGFENLPRVSLESSLDSSLESSLESSLAPWLPRKKNINGELHIGRGSAGFSSR